MLIGAGAWLKREQRCVQRVAVGGEIGGGAARRAVDGHASRSVERLGDLEIGGIAGMHQIGEGEREYHQKDRPRIAWRSERASGCLSDFSLGAARGRRRIAFGTSAFSIENLLMICGLPLSKSWKSSLRRVPTACPSRSRTTTGMLTKFTPALNVGVSRAVISGAVILGAACCARRLAKAIRTTIGLTGHQYIIAAVLEPHGTKRRWALVPNR